MFQVRETRFDLGISALGGVIVRIRNLGRILAVIGQIGSGEKLGQAGKFVLRLGFGQVIYSDRAGRGHRGWATF